MSRYRVRLARPVFQVVVVDVEADDGKEAVVKALSHAEMIPEADWSGAFEPEKYFYDAQYVTEVEEAEGDQDRAAIFGHSVDRYTRYLLLKADTFSGEGDVLYQPWLNAVSDPLIGDICRDWTADLEKARDEGVAGFFKPSNEAAEDAKRKPAKVIPIKRPAPEDT